ncbi:MAG: acyloxyacyl hydrolase, partial [Caulobacterales bacterium]
GLGYVIHDGEEENPYTPGTPQSTQFADTHVLFGSRDLFRTSLGLTKELGESWSAQLFFSHLSHGNIIGDGHNQGLDQLGVRMGYRFGGGD